MGRRPVGCVPSYCRHRRSGRGFVLLGGRQVYLPGDFGSEQSRTAYERALAEWRANGFRLPEVDGGEPYLVRDLCADYLLHCEVYYRHADGTPTHETDRVSSSLRELLKLYGDTEARDFGLAELKAVRGAMIAADLCRKNVNDRIGRIVRAFGWAVEELRVPAAVYGELRSLRRLKRGRSEARETEPIRPVPWAAVEAMLSHTSAPVRDMVLLMWWCGARVGEVVRMRVRDIDRTHGDVWAFRPDRHKGSFRDKERVIGLGPRCISVLRPYLVTRVPPLAPDAFVFRPAEATEAQVARHPRRRLYRLGDKRRVTIKVKSKRPPGAFYTVDAVRRAITRACKRAGVEPWSPLQLRHSAATRLRAEAGLEAARLALGHSDSATTLIYAEADKERVLQLMRLFA